MCVPALYFGLGTQTAAAVSYVTPETVSGDTAGKYLKHLTIPITSGTQIPIHWANASHETEFGLIPNISKQTTNCPRVCR